MINASELLLTEVTTVIYEMFPEINVEFTKGKLSSVITKYEIKNAESEESESDLQEKIKLYISSKKLEGLSEKTLHNYRSELTIFSNNVNKKLNDISPADIRIYLGEFNHLKKSSLGGKLSIIKSFFKWLFNEEIIRYDPALKIKPPKVEKRMPKSLTIENLELMRESCKTLRERVFLEVMYATGCRLGEVKRLNISDIDFQSNSCRVIGKGNKEREVYFSFKAMYHLEKYIKNRKDNCEALMISSKKPYRRLCDRAIQREIERIGKHAGLKVSPHDLRRTFAMLTLNNGASLIAIQELLGHENPETTLKYARITEERKREQHKKFLIQ